LPRSSVHGQQADRSLTRSGLPPSTGGERALSYMRENFEGLSEETLADFLTKNRERHPVEPDLNPGGRLTCLSDEELAASTGSRIISLAPGAPCSLMI
jgi:hypothetical protein